MFPQFITIGSLSAALAVALGAFGAHGLKSKVSKERLETYQTGVHYQMYHSVGIIIAGILSFFFRVNPFLSWAAWLMLTGIILFSGSLYLLVFTDKSWLGFITPFGGVAFIAGWVILALSVFMH